VQHILGGIDGCSGGWAVASADEHFTSFALRQITSIADLFSDGNAPSIVAIDMPIGLPDHTGPKRRTPERLVRPCLGERQSSVFSIPSRSAVYAGIDPSEPDERKRYIRACEICSRNFGRVQSSCEAGIPYLSEDC
jgi:predicted RNase H-like nuclease